MIEVLNLTKTYGPIEAVRDISFSIETGQACGFLGPNGAGKTTTMRVITGFMPATSGTVVVDGFDVFADSHEVRARIGYLPETPPLYAEMRVADYLDHVARLKQLPRSAVKQAQERAIERCGLERVAHRLCGQLSKGYKQRVGLAQALIHEPAVLVLDEPTVGLDPEQIIEIRDLIRGLAKERTVILSTHILPEVSAICQKVVIISHGQVALESELAPLTESGGLEDQYLKAVSGEITQVKSASTANGES